MRAVVIAVFLCVSAAGAALLAQAPGLPVPTTPLTADGVASARAAAERHDADAEFTLCMAHFLGLGGVAREPDVAMTWCRTASDDGSAAATYFVGVIYTTRQGGAADRVEALKWFRLAAERGNPAGQIAMARAYEDGNGVVKDLAQAVTWYRAAAAQGNSIAEGMLGDLFAAGRGVEQSHAEAAMWYQLSADHGNGYGAIKLAELYDKGLGVPRDPAAALRYYRMEADKGGPAAQFYVGVSYRDGRGGVAKDPIEAHKWFNIAAALAGENPAYAAARDAVETSMAPNDAAEARRRAHDWVVTFFSRVQSSPEMERQNQALLDRVDRKPR